MSGSSKRVTRSRLRAAELQADRQDATINSVNHGSRAPHSTDSAQDGMVDVKVEDTSPSQATPGTLESTPAIFGSGYSTGTMTRSAAAKRHFDTILTGNLNSNSHFQDRLISASIIAGRGPITPTTNLEDSRDIQNANPGEQEESEEQVQQNIRDDEPRYDEVRNRHGIVSTSRFACSSGRTRSQNGKVSTREGTPYAVPQDHARRPRQNQKSKQNSRVITRGRLGLRRSARLAKPLEEFHLFPNLPPEIQLMIWAAAMSPRLVYIFNRSTSAFSFPLHTMPAMRTRLPTWFMTTRLSALIARENYRNLFRIYTTLPMMSVTSWCQAVQPAVDIVLYEPCNSGCRARYCAQQYLEADRRAVKSLAVQIDSPRLIPGIDPGWASVSITWENVENLYFVQPAIKGRDDRDKAMIRIKEGPHEEDLRKRFDQWKKNAGKELKLSKLEFVTVVEKESESIKISDRYQSVKERKTGLVEDIIIG